MKKTRLRCVIEMALFNRHPKGQGLVTNLINRDPENISHGNIVFS